MTQALQNAIQWTEEMVSIPSVTPSEERILLWLEDWCRKRGLLTRRQEVSDTRWNLLAWKGEPRLWFSTHVDTVPPFLPFRRVGERLMGRGACDTHGGLACMLAVLEDLAARDADAGLLIVVGEEVDHSGAILAGSSPLPGAKERVIVLCEPTHMKMARAQKGVLKILLRSEGRAAHSSLPHLGESAVLPLLAACETLLNHAWPADETLGETLLNLGRIEGGVASNVIPPAASADFCFRTVREQAWYLDEFRRLLADHALHWETEGAGEPQVFDPLPDWETYVAPYGTDAAYLRPLGRILLVGPGRIEVAHSVDEEITVDELRQGIAGYRSISEHILGPITWS